MKTIILDTKIRGKKISQTLLREDGKLQRRENVSHGPVTIRIGNTVASFKSMVTDTLFHPEEK